MILEEGKVEGDPLLAKDDSPPQPFLWSDPAFDAIKFIRYLLPFHEDFPINYKSIHNMSPPEMSILEENHLLRGLLMERVQFFEEIRIGIFHTQ